MLELGALLSPEVIEAVDRSPLQVRFNAEIDASAEDFERRIRWFNIIVRNLQNAHGPLELDRLKYVTIASRQTLPAAVRRLEEIAGRELPAARNGVEGSMSAFLVDLGQIDVVFAVDEDVFPWPVKSDERTADAIGEIASVIAAVDYWSKVKRMVGADPKLEGLLSLPRSSRYFQLAADVLGAYHRGRVGYIAPMASHAAVSLLAKSLTLDLTELQDAERSYGANGDLQALEFRMIEAAQLLTAAMAQCHGLVHAMHGDARSIPEVAARIRLLGLEEVFAMVGDMCRSVHEKIIWSAMDVFSLCAPARSLLMSRGLMLGETTKGKEIVSYQPPGSSVAH